MIHEDGLICLNVCEIMKITSYKDRDFCNWRNANLLRIANGTPGQGCFPKARVLISWELRLFHIRLSYVNSGFVLTKDGYGSEVCLDYTARTPEHPDRTV